MVFSFVFSSLFFGLKKNHCSLTFKEKRSTKLTELRFYFFVTFGINLLELKINSTLASFLMITLTILGGVSEVFAQKRKKQDDEAFFKERILREAEASFTEAEKYFILEDFSKALLFYQKTLELTPDNATVHFKIADLFSRSTRTEDLQKAASSIEKALSLEKKNKYFYLLAANIFSALGENNKAIQAYENLLKEIPNTEEYLYDLAGLYLFDNKTELAIKTYEKAEQVLGINEFGVYQKVRILLEQQKLQDAKAEAEKLLSSDWQEGVYANNLAEIFAANGQIEIAISILEKSIKEEASESAQLQILLANLYKEKGNLAKANELWLSLFTLADVSFETKAMMLAQITDEINYNNTADNTEKVNLFNRLFPLLEKAHPEEGKVFVLLADFKMVSGNDAQAIEAYHQAIKLGEENAEVFQNLLLLHARKNNYQQLIDVAQSALELYPNQAAFYYYAGFGYFMKKQYNLATGVLEQAKKLSAGNTNFLQDIGSLLGDAYQYTRDFTKSEKAYDDVLSINPNNESVLNNYAYYLSLRKSNLEKAEAMSKKLIELYPDNPTFLDTHAWVLYTKGQFKEAKKIMEKVINSGKANATHLEHYGDILYKLGQINDAVAQWEKAKQLNANSETLSKKIANRTLYEQ